MDRILKQRPRARYGKVAQLHVRNSLPHSRRELAIGFHFSNSAREAVWNYCKRKAHSGSGGLMRRSCGVRACHLEQLIWLETAYGGGIVSNQ
jgi:hypothetical protein